MKYTTNFNLKKPDYTDPADIKDFNDNSDSIDAKLKEHASELADNAKDYVRSPAYGQAAGAVNAYTFSAMPATALVDGMCVYLDNVIATNTGASTFNWSGLGAKAIVNSKGVALTAGKMPLNCIVGLRYNASASNFQLLGEGGEYGTATIDKVLIGNTIGTENGIVAGTIPIAPQYPGNNTASACDIYPNKPNALHNLFLQVPKGYYDATWLGFDIPNLVPANILNGVTIGNGGIGVTGTAVNGAGMKNYAEGTITTPTSTVTVTGLSFTPSTVIVRMVNPTMVMQHVYTKNMVAVDDIANQGEYQVLPPNDYSSNSHTFTVSSGGFSVHVSAGGDFKWKAYS